MESKYLPLSENIPLAEIARRLNLIQDRAEIPAILVRQTVLAGAVDATGLPTFISIGTGLSVDIAATAVPIRLTAAAGFDAYGAIDRMGSVAANTTLSSLTANQTNYLYADIAADGTVTLGKTTLAPVYQFGGAYSTVNGQFTFNIQEMTGKVGNGSTATQTYRIYIGEAVCGVGTVTSVVNYALMGRYDSGLVATLPGTSAAISLNHNIGVKGNQPMMYLECITTDAGYAIGDRVRLTATGNASYAVPNTITSQTNTAGFSTGPNSPFLVSPKAGGAFVLLTAAKWKYGMTVTRGW